MHHCHLTGNCIFCKFLSRVFGHPLMFILRRKWEKIQKDEVIYHMRSLDLELVGGLAKRGWTVHDIDIIGNPKDVPVFIQRLKDAKIQNPIHFCDKGEKRHSHIFCLWNGLMLVLNWNFHPSFISSKLP